MGMIFRGLSTQPCGGGAEPVGQPARLQPCLVGRRESPVSEQVPCCISDPASLWHGPHEGHRVVDRHLIR